MSSLQEVSPYLYRKEQMKRFLNEYDDEYWIGQRFLSHYTKMFGYQHSAISVQRELQMLDRKYEGMNLDAVYKYLLDKMPPHIRKKYGKEG